MASAPQKAFCVLRFSQCESVITVQCDFLNGMVLILLHHRALDDGIPTTMDELRNRITTAVESVTQDMLAAVWDEFEYRIDICLVSKGGHIEHL
ncbi:hypothetical protein J6590_025272 [Homalodisca vitripennis]|nr:hypothetical protein J6590_025272 [Homalodisca vitripennis]